MCEPHCDAASCAIKTGSAVSGKRPRPLALSCRKALQDGKDIAVDLFKDRLAWDSDAGTITDGPARYVLIRADALMGLFHGLAPADRPAAFAAFQYAVARFGGRSARRYHQSRHAGDPDVLALVAAGAPQLGWGSWSVDRSGEAIAITVENSPFAAGFGDAGHGVCAPVAGMLQAAASIAFGRGMVAHERCCAAAGAKACRFELVPVPAT
ncbi:V4R domain-containing protein [Sphingopyxis sp.]|uniref:V4R domain-containing protein n=1 Tax=Sphingopyxis sp. TaxID=1908224 RepID=UPI002FC8155E